MTKRVISCVDYIHKKMADVRKFSVAQLRARRRRLSRALGNPEAVLFGSLLTQGRRCGKEGCRCATGELHGPYVYIALRKPRGSSGLLYVPAELADAVRKRVELTAQMQAVLEEISEINLELLRRRKLD
jgi:hypothetical protein